MSSGLWTEMNRILVAVWPRESTARTVKDKKPVPVVGVPAINPVLDNVRPAGSVPDHKLHVTAPTPVAASCASYAAPTAARGRLVVVIVRALMRTDSG